MPGRIMGNQSIVNMHPTGHHHYGIIFCDMDGVLVDFLGGAEAVLGHPFDTPYLDKVEKQNRRKLVMSHSGFWANLKPLSDYKLLWNFINPYDAEILTAVASWDEHCGPGKLQWLDKHLRVPHTRVHVVRREQKQLFAKSGIRQNILIDDHPKNVQEFSAAGGIAIHHVNAKVTIMKLKEMGFR
jgi:deoxypyrimidine-specific 5' nucleotidase type C protein (NT5C)